MKAGRRSAFAFWPQPRVALGGLLAGCGGGGDPVDVVGLTVYPHARDYPIHGIDVSKYQGDIDWNAVANSGVKFVWIKATEGGDRADESIPGQLGGRQDGGHSAWRLSFRLLVPPADRGDELVRAERAGRGRRAAAGARRRGDADVERPATAISSSEPAIADMKVMLDEMERHFGRRPIIYTSVDFYEAILSDGAFSDYPIWVRSTKHHPSVKYGSRAWHFWQYQSDGSIPGIRPCRPRRVLRHPGAMAGVSRGSRTAGPGAAQAVTQQAAATPRATPQPLSARPRRNPSSMPPTLRARRRRNNPRRRWRTIMQRAAQQPGKRSNSGARS